MKSRVIVGIVVGVICLLVGFIGGKIMSGTCSNSTFGKGELNVNYA